MTEAMQDFLDGKRAPRTRWEYEWGAFHKKNPQIWELFDAIAKWLIKKGIKRVGFATIEERIRWLHWVRTRDDNSGYKLNHNYVPYYARLWLELNPSHGGFFKLKKLRAKAYLGVTA